MREVIPTGSGRVGEAPLDQMVPTGASQCVFWGSGGGEKIILSLCRSFLKCAWSFKGSPTGSKWNMFVNKQLLLTQLWVVRGVCFSLCCWSLLTISSRFDTSKQVDVCGGGAGGGESKGKNHRSLFGLFFDGLGTALAGGKSCWLKRMRLLDDLWRSPVL